MKYEGTKLVLDNFRTVLKGLPLDIQDIVRSAILDDVDIESYIDSCSNNPYRLDQIRLSMKEGLSDRFYTILNGDIIHKIRVLRNKGLDLSSLEIQMDKGTLSDRYYEMVLSWIEDGINFESLNIAKIPPTLLDVFDKGLRKNVDMKPFNTGNSYSPEYIKNCIVISGNEYSINIFLAPHVQWYEDVVKQLADLSNIKTNKNIYTKVVNTFDHKTKPDRARYIILLAKRGVEPSLVQERIGVGTYKYSIEALEAIYKAVVKGFEWKTLYAGITDPEVMMMRFREHDMKKGKKIGGKLT